MVIAMALMTGYREDLQNKLGANQRPDSLPALIGFDFGLVLSFEVREGVPREILQTAIEGVVARTIRFPAALREKITADAERCGRSFDGQVIALLRRHYGEDVDIAPTPAEILALAAASLADVPAAELRSLTRKLQETES